MSLDFAGLLFEHWVERPDRVANCRECGADFEYPACSGRPPTVCPACKERRAWRPTKEEAEAHHGWTNCLRCGERFEWKGAPRRYCSAKCRTGTARALIPCAQCGAQFEPWIKTAKFCSEVCQQKEAWAYFKARTGRASTRIKDTSERPCKECGAAFAPAYGERRRAYCSAECSETNKQRLKREAKKAKLAPKRLVACVGCSKQFTANSSNHRFCSPECRAYQPKPRKQRDCAVCGLPFMPRPGRGLGARYCGKRCRKKAARKRPSYRIIRSIAKVRRRSVLAMARVERVDPLAVFARDKWKCQLCGIRAPRKLVGTNDPRAPTLDHIIPLALGGEHSYRNTQCACRDCNNRKAHGPGGQLRLFG